MLAIWKHPNFLSLIIYGLAFVEYCLPSADSTNSVENCISESQNCTSIDGRVICYRVCSNISRSWNVAQRICAQHHSTLPVIRNKKEQESLESYLSYQKTHTRISGVVWTSGRKNTTHGGWTWLNGQPLRGRIVFVKALDTKDNTHAILIKNDSLKKENPLHSAWYMCQYRGNSCKKERSLQLMNSCVVLSTNSTSWYGARNACLDSGGDLAFLSDGDLNEIFRSHSTAVFNPNNGGTKQYWIGLRRISWHWALLNNETEDVKYSKWARVGVPLDSNLCISINSSNGEWVARSCNDGNSVICQNGGNISPGATEISETSTLGPKAPSNSINSPTESADEVPTTTITTTTPTITPTTPSSTQMGKIFSTTSSTRMVAANSTAISSDKFTPEKKGTMYAMIGVGVLLIFLCITFIFLLIRRRQKRAKEIRNSTKANTIQSSNGSDPEEESNKRTPKTKTISADVVRGVYAEISLAKNSNKDMENAPSNPLPTSGSVYASLEFQKDTPIYAEPVKKSNSANAQT